MAVRVACQLLEPAQKLHTRHEWLHTQLWRFSLASPLHVPSNMSGQLSSAASIVANLK
jgi:hypothetical protein